MFNGLIKEDFTGEPLMNRIKNILIWFVMLNFSLMAIAAGQSGRNPGLIRDTDVADETEEKTEAPKPKDPDPIKSKANLKTGNFYFKSKNYIAAIDRYLEALEYQPDSIEACEALGRAYEKNGDISKAVDLYTRFAQKNPDSPKSSEMLAKASKLQKYVVVTPVK
jgi:tetratricopeptide (TPR) repeat protein